MFLEPGQHAAHGLDHDPIKAIVAPRPIGWITTVSPTGVVNVAPYSFFNLVSGAPPTVFFAASGRTRAGGVKDSQANAEATGEFVVNVATLELADVMNETSIEVGPEVDEAELVGLGLVPSERVRAPRIAASPLHLECRWKRSVGIPDEGPATTSFMVLGEVVGIHIDERVLDDRRRIDATRVRPLSRLGYQDYATVTEVFEIGRPTGGDVSRR
ncbi:MAG: hypothetical protein RLZZ272_1574 [Actinomycetota bacterium]